MDFGDALATIGGLSKPSKMPWFSWSISAEDCMTGGKLNQVEGTVCSGCYALKGRYLFPNVKEAHQRRLAALGNPFFEDAFVTVLTKLHSRQRGRKENRFRWLDSGDLQSVEMLETINRIAERTPQIRHWLPTRELGIVREFLDLHGEFASNLVVRISVAKIGDVFERSPFGLPYASVAAANSTAAHQCSAREKQGNRCLACDICWTRANINYPLH